MEIGLYIGAGLDLKIAKYLFHIKKLIFIDKNPQFKNEQNNNNTESFFNTCFCYPKTKNNNMYEYNNFIQDIKYVALKEGFILQKMSCYKDIEKLVFKNGNQEIIYYVNVSIPEDLEFIEETIFNYNNLIVKEHIPDSSILKYTERLITFWGDKTICYNSDINSCKNSICYNLNNDNYNEYFKKYNIIEDKGLNIVSMKTWKELVEITKLNCLKKKLIPLNL